MVRNRPITAVILMSLAAGAADAQVSRGGSNANAQLAQQMQQLASERTALQAEAARTKKELEDMRKERDTLKNAQQSLDQRARSSSAALAQATAQRDAAQQDLKQTKQKMDQLIGKFRETVQQMREIETDRTTATQNLTARERELKVCLDHNQGLYKLNDEVLTHLEKDSRASHIASADPFTKIERVQLENLVDDYRGRADDQHLTPATIGAATRAAKPPPPTSPVSPAPATTAPATAPAPANSTSATVKPQAAPAPQAVPAPNTDSPQP